MKALFIKDLIGRWRFVDFANNDDDAGQFDSENSDNLADKLILDYRIMDLDEEI